MAADPAVSKKEGDTVVVEGIGPSEVYCHHDNNSREEVAAQSCLARLKQPTLYNKPF